MRLYEKVTIFLRARLLKNRQKSSTSISIFLCGQLRTSLIIKNGQVLDI